MWKLLHALFGWDYIVISIGWSDHVVRVRQLPDGERRFIHLYGSYWEIRKDGKAYPMTGGEPKRYAPLTWAGS